MGFYSILKLTSTTGKVLKDDIDKIILGKDDGTLLKLERKYFNFLPEVGEVLEITKSGNSYIVEKHFLKKITPKVVLQDMKIDGKNLVSRFKNLSIWEQVISALIAITAIIVLFSVLSDKKEVVTSSSNRQVSYSRSIIYSKAEKESYNSSSSNNSSSTEASSSKEIWAPTSQVDVNKYLNIPQTKIILRAKILQKIDYKLEGGSNIYEVEAESMGIFEPETYREYSIPGDRLLIRTTHDLSPYINQVMVYTGNTISQQTYGTIGKGALTILEFRKTAQAQEAERASIEASKAQAEAAQRAQIQQAPAAPSSATATPATPAPAPQTGLRPFNNCTEARRAGRTNIPASDPQYGPWLDRDKDGFGCDD